MMEQLLDRALATLAEWRAHGVTLTLAVNASAVTLEDVESTQRLADMVRRHGLLPSDLTVELTETVIAEEHGRLLESLVRLRMAGFGVALDDFGTGFSSLQQLSCSPFTELKIDRSFVTGAADVPRKMAILEWIVGLARRLKMRVVAEGIETEADLALVAGLQEGQGQGQGYLATPPLPADEFLQWCLRFAGWPTRDSPANLDCAVC